MINNSFGAIYIVKNCMYLYYYYINSHFILLILYTMINVIITIIALYYSLYFSCKTIIATIDVSLVDFLIRHQI